MKYYLSIFLFLVVLLRVTPDYGRESSIYFYNDVAGCECFLRCGCWHYDLNDFEEQSITKSGLWPSWERGTPTAWLHDLDPADLAWHLYVKEVLKAKKKGPYIDRSIRAPQELLMKSDRDPCMLIDYFERIEDVNLAFDAARDKWVKSAEELFACKAISVKEKEEKIDRAQKQAIQAKASLEGLPSLLMPCFEVILEKCPHKRSWNKAYFLNRSYLSYLGGNYLDAVDHLAFLINDPQNALRNRLNSRNKTVCGEVCLETGKFLQAIEWLTEAIEADPKNKEAYYLRATAYFETGDFDLSIRDFIETNYANERSSVPSMESYDIFVRGLFSGLYEGGQESLREFAPSLLSSVYGVGHAIWSFYDSPFETSVSTLHNVCDFAEASYFLARGGAEYVKNLDKEKIAELCQKCSKEVFRLLHQFEEIPLEEKGQLIGRMIGRYGVEAYSYSVTFGGTSKVIQKIKKANRLCNIQKLAHPRASAQIKTAATTHKLARDQYLRTVTLHRGKQDKRIMGTDNYERGKSLFTHPDPVRLLNNFTGKGEPVVPGTKFPKRGEPIYGYGERVDFGEIIGRYLQDGQEGPGALTTMGIIRYDKNYKAHIVPAEPKMVKLNGK